MTREGYTHIIVPTQLHAQLKTLDGDGDGFEFRLFGLTCSESFPSVSLTTCLLSLCSLLLHSNREFVLSRARKCPTVTHVCNA